MFGMLCFRDCVTTRYTTFHTEIVDSVTLYDCNMPMLHENLAPVVRKADNAIHRINHYPADSVVCFVNTYPLDSDFIRWIALSSLRTTGARSLVIFYVQQETEGAHNLIDFAVQKTSIIL